MSTPSNSDLTRPASSAATGDALSDELNAEIEAAMAQLDREADALGAQNAKKAEKDKLSSGRPAHIRGPRLVQAGREHRTGQVVSVGPTDIFLEFGPKELGIVPRAQFPDTDVPKVGDSIEVVVDKFEAGESLFVCSRPGAVQKADWELLESGQVVEARVTGVATGKDGKQVGLELEVAGHRAFMPASQVALDRVPDFSVFVGEKMNCAVVRVERVGKGNIVLSRRDVLNTERKRLAEETKKNLTEGQSVEGIVRKIMPFGAFVDIGGVDGLIHISDLSYDKIGFGEKAVEKHVKEGQRVTVKVLKVDIENNRISLGLKQVQGDPFATAANAITEGAEITGKVTKLLEFGAFVEVAPGVDGLVHIS
ncbi:MAG: S1 RNA-binding domain-containing protein, partial [Planctomycetes bacterium]|nr:S1 RNA-binding domain-containing protein [Planctomycetota bacterium]